LPSPRHGPNLGRLPSPDVPPARVLLLRGSLEEAEHRVRVAVWRGGVLAAYAGAVDLPVHLRSAAKPLQALAAVVTGAAERFAMTQAELALACGSHGGEPFHVATAAGLLERLGLTPDALRCGVHEPAYTPAGRELAAHGAHATVLHNNCSGKHSAMLAACVAAGWPTDGYLAPEHPLQVLNREHVATFAGLRPEGVSLATDGCSAPVFVVPLSAAARAFAVYTTPEPGDGVAGPLRSASERLLAALAARPEMIGGTRRVDTDLLRVTAGRVLAKVGAEGVWCLGVRGQRLGVAVKCEDGSQRGARPVGLAVLRALGALSDAEWAALGEHHDPVLRNHRDLVVGRLEVVPTDGVEGLPSQA
jgi:L-asparaginase II